MKDSQIIYREHLNRGLSKQQARSLCHYTNPGFQGSLALMAQAKMNRLTELAAKAAREGISDEIVR